MEHTEIDDWQQRRAELAPRCEQLRADMAAAIAKREPALLADDERRVQILEAEIAAIQQKQRHTDERAELIDRKIAELTAQQKQAQHQQAINEFRRLAAVRLEIATALVGRTTEFLRALDEFCAIKDMMADHARAHTLTPSSSVLRDRLALSAWLGRRLTIERNLNLNMLELNYHAIGLDLLAGERKLLASLLDASGMEAA